MKTATDIDVGFWARLAQMWRPVPAVQTARVVDFVRAPTEDNRISPVWLSQESEDEIDDGCDDEIALFLKKKRGN